MEPWKAKREVCDCTDSGFLVLGEARVQAVGIGVGWKCAGVLALVPYLSGRLV